MVREVPLVRSVLYPTTPGTTWYDKMEVSSAMDRFARLPPILWKAALLGMKQVRSRVLSTVFTSERLVSAPTAEVRFKATAVAEIFCGRVRNRLTTWMIPPVKLVVLVTLEVVNKPEMKLVLDPPKASTRWPPVTFAYAPGCKALGMKEMLVKLLYVPFRTW